MAIDTKSLIFIIAIAVVVLIGIIFIIRRARGGRSSSVESNSEQIYIGNLPYRVNERDLREYFAGYGRIKSIRVVKDRNTGRSKGYGFITYASANEAKKALVEHGREMDGRGMVVRIAKPR